LQLYREHSPSIVITDWMIPDVSGVELCQQIRADNSRPYTYIILMTGGSRLVNATKGLQAGADDYLTTPFDEGEMLARIGVGRRIIELNRALEAKTRKLEEVAQTDLLTGLPNRRALEQWADKELQGAIRHGFHFWVVLCDIDSFKTINDTFGHEAGDSVLRRFADLIWEGTRRSDICGRLGGDEFLLLVTHVNVENIELTINRVRDKFASFTFTFGGKAVKCTASFGVAGFQGKSAYDFKFLLREADRMLYEAKCSGRNRVRVPTLDNPALASLRPPESVLSEHEKCTEVRDRVAGILGCRDNELIGKGRVRRDHC
jgi:two-component system, cell cycle response regulator